ncbi:hypothetical protein RchiOBHm_Chr1g0382311 [Rosa chinensis]|uniref:Uncharacterized protein n=1 Tax=Rosa chinensis TaxID=74649 RepID=A0A2P6SPD1_ROSCH|nr:hypothetical protein RchiOBHm_Chr1g0382311 [Rosa chinensis]
MSLRRHNRLRPPGSSFSCRTISHAISCIKSCTSTWLSDEIVKRDFSARTRLVIRLQGSELSTSSIINSLRYSRRKQAMSRKIFFSMSSSPSKLIFNSLKTVMSGVCCSFANAEFHSSRVLPFKKDPKILRANGRPPAYVTKLLHSSA